MDLSLDQAIRIKDGPYKGIYRIVALTKSDCYLAVIETEFAGIRKRGPKTLNPSSNPVKNTTTFQLVILPLTKVEELVAEFLLEKVEFKLSNRALKSAAEKPSSHLRHQQNLALMCDFLDTSKLVEKVIRDKGFSGLVSTTVHRSNVCSRKIYRKLKRLILYGFLENSLIPEYYKSGGPGTSRPHKEGMKKCGAKPLLDHYALNNHLEPQPRTGGMTEEWRNKCAIAISKIPRPHPSIPIMYRRVLDDQFSQQLEIINGAITPLKIQTGAYPTIYQFRYFLKKHFTPLEHSKRITTNRNYAQNHRGLLGYSYEGVGGPGHTYAIDSTLADIYLVSTLNRQVVIGRPVLYFIVDVWSGAIVGFYICLSGPKWEMAKVALFNAVYDPEKMAALMGIPYIQVFKHKPGLCAVLLCDRGEHISHKAAMTCLDLKLDQEFTAPYRGDGKGIVEVQFRINKDEQINFVLGTHDARRKEMDQRESKPLDATMTLHEYTIYVSSMIRKYNQTADMSKRLTDTMKAYGVNPTPASLWDWGHDIGIGFKKHMPEDELIRILLPKVDANSTKNGIKTSGRLYADQDNANDKEMAALARNYGEQPVDVWIYPGTINTVWTNEGCEEGLRLVPRSGCDSSYVSEEEYRDAAYISNIQVKQNAHSRIEIVLQEHKLQKATINESIQLKKLDKGLKPAGKQNVSDNREAEHAYLMHQEIDGKGVSKDEQNHAPQPADDSYRRWLENSLMESDNE